MKSFKPEMSPEAALRVLREVEGESLTDIRPIEMGELSRVFSYRKAGKEYVIHFKDNRDSLEKERFIHDRYAAAHRLPVPQVHKIGSLENLHYSIADKMPGAPISTLEPAFIRETVPNLVQLYLGMSRIPAGDTGGYGWITPEGKAGQPTWTDFLTATFAENQEGFYEGWTSLFDGDILERDVFDRLYEKMVGLAAYAPDEGYLVHGDFHLGNMLAADGRVTGIVDWEMAMSGDFMFDVAVMDLWAPRLEFPKRLLAAAELEGGRIPDFRERLLCYQLFKGIDGLRFYAKKNHKPSYQFMKDRIYEVLAGSK